MYVAVLPECMCAYHMHVSGAIRDKKKKNGGGVGSLGLELQIAVNNYVLALNR